MNDGLLQDEYGTIENGEQTYLAIAKEIQSYPMVIAWTDNEGSQLDVLLVLRPRQVGFLQGGVRGSTDLFVSIMRLGAFGFDTGITDTHPSYIGEKLRLGDNVTTDKLTELINGIRRYL